MQRPGTLTAERRRVQQYRSYNEQKPQDPPRLGVFEWRELGYARGQCALLPSGTLPGLPWYTSCTL